MDDGEEDRIVTTPTRSQTQDAEKAALQAADEKLFRISMRLTVVGIVLLGVGVVLGLRWVSLPGLAIGFVGALVNLIRFLPVRPLRK